MNSNRLICPARWVIAPASLQQVCVLQNTGIYSCRFRFELQLHDRALTSLLAGTPLRSEKEVVENHGTDALFNFRDFVDLLKDRDPHKRYPLPINIMSAAPE